MKFILVLLALAAIAFAQPFGLLAPTALVSPFSISSTFANQFSAEQALRLSALDRVMASSFANVMSSFGIPIGTIIL